MRDGEAGQLLAIETVGPSGLGPVAHLQEILAAEGSHRFIDDAFARCWRVSAGGVDAISVAAKTAIEMVNFMDASQCPQASRPWLNLYSWTAISRDLFAVLRQSDAEWELDSVDFLHIGVGRFDVGRAPCMGANW